VYNSVFIKIGYPKIVYGYNMYNIICIKTYYVMVLFKKMFSFTVYLNNGLFSEQIRNL